MSSPTFESIEAYLEAVDPVKAETIRSVIDFILSEFPELAPKIAWNVPTLHRDGQYVVGITAYKNHITFSAFSSAVIDTYKECLEKHYKVFKNCFHIPVDWEMDKKLVKELVQGRLAELD